MLAGRGVPECVGSELAVEPEPSSVNPGVTDLHADHCLEQSVGTVGRLGCEVLDLGTQILIEDPSGNPVELFQPAT